MSFWMTRMTTAEMEERKETRRLHSGVWKMRGCVGGRGRGIGEGTVYIPEKIPGSQYDATEGSVSIAGWSG